MQVPTHILRSNKTLIGAVLFVIVLIGSFSWWAQDRISNAERVELGDTLNTVLVATHEAVKAWLDEHQATARVWANTPILRENAEALLALPHSEAALAGAPEQGELRNLLAPIQKGQGYLGYFVISPDNINISSSRTQNIGVTSLLAQQEEFFQKIWSGGTAVSLPVESDVPLPDAQGRLREGRPTMFVGAPILDESGRVIATFTFRIDPARALTRAMRQGRLGSTGETYAFDASGRLISESRFEPELRKIGLLEPNQGATLNLEIRDPGVNLLEGERSTEPQAERPLTRMAEQAVAGYEMYDFVGGHQTTLSIAQDDDQKMSAWYFFTGYGADGITEAGYLLKLWSTNVVDPGWRPAETNKTFTAVFNQWEIGGPGRGKKNRCKGSGYGLDTSISITRTN